MKVILYMAMTANGMIAKSDGNSDWVSSEETKSFIKNCRQNQVVILGRTSFEGFDENYPLPLKTGIHYVLTKNKSLQSKNPLVKFTGKNPSDLIRDLKTEGHKQVCIIGGSTIASEFMEQNLIDEVYLDIEPLFFGKGMPLFLAASFEKKLELIETKKLSSQTIQLHYKVQK